MKSVFSFCFVSIAHMKLSLNLSYHHINLSWVGVDPLSISNSSMIKTNMDNLSGWPQSVFHVGLKACNLYCNLDSFSLYLKIILISSSNLFNLFLFLTYAIIVMESLSFLKVYFWNYFIFSSAVLSILRDRLFW